MDKKSKVNFLIGLVLGVNIAILCMVSYNFAFSNMAKKDKSQEKIAALIAENENLKEEVNQLKTVKDGGKSQETQELSAHTVNTTPTSVTIDITREMSYDQIADALVQNGVYPHKNDLLMIIELLNFDRYNSAQALQDYGIINNGEQFNQALKSIEQRSSAVSEVLYASRLIQDKKSFMKLIYLGNLNTNITYGQKAFTTGSSLREICDVLMQ